MNRRTPRESETIQVHDFWERASCGEDLLLASEDVHAYASQSSERYRLEPYILDFAEFDSAKGKNVLEIGVGLGADHQKFAEAGAKLHGIDLTRRAIEHTKRRISALGLQSDLQVADAERIPFPENTFDLVYSWGVIHHAPDTPAIAREILRVLRPGGRFKIMIYHRNSLVGYMLWLRYALMRLRPWTSLDSIYSRYLESPGTKAYTPEEGCALFNGAQELRWQVVLTHGDLLESGAGQRHHGLALSFARKIWPRTLLRRFMSGHGLFLLIEGSKPEVTR